MMTKKSKGTFIKTRIKKTSITQQDDLKKKVPSQQKEPKTGHCLKLTRKT
jgi:hypothetical protein